MKTMKHLLFIAGLAMILVSSCKKDEVSSVSSASSVDDATQGAVTFVYNGDSVTYGTILSPTTGRRWLDRNLGATRKAKSVTDYVAYGDLFQWGRPDDGHQLINWTSSTTGTGVTGTTTTLAKSDHPKTKKMILATYASPWIGDWRDDNNQNRWYTNPKGPCPKGWHVPTLDEWKAEISISEGGTATSGGIKDPLTAYSLLKLTMSGMRYGWNGWDGAAGGDLGISSAAPGTMGSYWSSTVSYFNTDVWASCAVFGSGGGFYAGVDADAISSARTVRCLKN